MDKGVFSLQETVKKEELIRLLLEEADETMSYEEALHLLLAQRLSSAPQEPERFSQKAADAMARFAGSWSFILIFSAFMAVWMGINLYALTNPFDPYPFILLNLVLSCISSVQSPLIMMSQNRQSETDRKRAALDHRIHLKNELIIEDLHKKLDELLSLQKEDRDETGNDSSAASERRPEAAGSSGYDD